MKKDVNVNCWKEEEGEKNVKLNLVNCETPENTWS